MKSLYGKTYEQFAEIMGVRPMKHLFQPEEEKHFSVFVDENQYQFYDEELYFIEIDNFSVVRKIPGFIFPLADSLERILALLTEASFDWEIYSKYSLQQRIVIRLIEHWVYYDFEFDGEKFALQMIFLAEPSSPRSDATIELERADEIKSRCGITYDQLADLMGVRPEILDYGAPGEEHLLEPEDKQNYSVFIDDNEFLFFDHELSSIKVYNHSAAERIPGFVFPLADSLERTLVKLTAGQFDWKVYSRHATPDWLLIRLQENSVTYEFYFDCDRFYLGDIRLEYRLS